MEMTPQRVRSAEFKTVRKGADPDEVKVFLNDIADELERAQNQSTAMEARARAAVARLQEVSGAEAKAAPASVDASAEESETISRTLLLAQRTADTAVAEARGEAARIVGAANNEAATTLDSTREMAAQLVAEARAEARQVGDAERASIINEVEALKARRDFLESDVEQLELFLTEQRSRLRDAATSLIDISERVPGGIGEARAPLLSAADDGPEDRRPGADSFLADGPAGGGPGGGNDASDVEDDLMIVTEVPDNEPTGESSGIPAWSDDGEPTEALSRVVTDDDQPDPGNADEDFRFSFDDNRS